MTSPIFVLRKTLDMLKLYWELMRIIVPIALVTQALAEAGMIRAVSPALAPVMGLYGLPPELAFAWLTGMLAGIWGGVVIVFTLVPPSDLTVADMTVLSALLLFAHAIPVEQRIIQKAGPRFLLTTAIRLGGGMIYAAILHLVLRATGWLAAPLEPAWIPMQAAAGWGGFLVGLAETLFWMLVILLALAWGLEILKRSGLMVWLDRSIAPLFGLAGIRGEAREFTAVGMFLGISYGGGLLIGEARANRIAPRQIFVACVFMGFAHGVIEDTLVVVALGADPIGVLVGRLVFAVVATALVARVVGAMADATFFSWLFDRRQIAPRPAGEGA